MTRDEFIQNGDYSLFTEELSDVSISDLVLSRKTRKALSGMGIASLNELVKDQTAILSSIEDFDTDILDETKKTIQYADRILLLHQVRRKRIKQICKIIGSSSIDGLNLSNRLNHALHRADIHTIKELLSVPGADLHKIRNMGEKSYQEAISAVEKIVGPEYYPHKIEDFESIDFDANFTYEQKRLEQLSFDNKERQKKISLRASEIGDISIDSVLDSRALNVLNRLNVHTIRDLLYLDLNEISVRRGIGEKSLTEVKNAIEGILSDGNLYIENRRSLLMAENDSTDSNDGPGKFDFTVIDDLRNRFSFAVTTMSEWYGLSGQAVINALDRRSPRRATVWTGKEISESEKKILCSLIQSHQMQYVDEHVTCLCMNDMQDDFVSLFKYSNEIRCFYLKDLPEDLVNQIKAANMHRFTLKELEGRSDGTVVHIFRKTYFRPNQSEAFRANAKIRSMTTEDYAVWFSGFPLADARYKTDEQIVEFLENNLVDGKVYIEANPENQWIRSLASRNGYGIREFVKFYGFEYAREGSELTTEGARKRHIEELKKHVIRDNQVYISTDSKIYRLLYTYSYQKGIAVNEYIRSLGFERTLERQEIPIKKGESDMQVRHSDGKLIDRIYAEYPLLGSKILRQETLDELNRLTRDYIDKVLRSPEIKLNLRAEMQITLALINNAKGWDYEKNHHFWNYITLQFGYRDTTGAVVRMLQTAMEDALKQNNRLFVEDSSSRYFKSTAVIHAFASGRSWRAVCEFLFDFYKENLHWRIIPGDPLLDTMIKVLQNKLLYDNSDSDEELIISTKIYSFQEGVRKLINLRPAYCRDLFERLITRIDALVNSSEKPASTYEEQLCDEWFKEKLAAIASSRKNRNHSREFQQEVVLDYSHIHARYILRNENDVRLTFPDIRLRNEQFEKALLSIYYDDCLVLTKAMSWYGNELGRTLNSTTVSLPEAPEDMEPLHVHVTITCDGENIYDSGDSLFRKLLVFSGSNEITVAQIQKGNYTFVLPYQSDFTADDAYVSYIEGFKNKGLRACFVELKDRFLIRLNGEVIAFGADDHTDIRVISPAESASFPHARMNGEEFAIAYRRSFCSFILGGRDLLQQYVVLRNGKRLEFRDLQAISNRRELGFQCALDSPAGSDCCRIQVLDIGSERLIYDQNFLLVDSADFSFDREFYYADTDYDAAKLTCCINGETETFYFSREDNQIFIPFHEGEICVDIPVIRIEENSGTWLNGTAPAWYLGAIPQTSVLKVYAPKNVNVLFLINGKEVAIDDDFIVTIGSVLHSMSGVESCDSLCLEMAANGRSMQKRYILARIYCREQFLSAPEFWEEKGRLYWNHGGFFIGDTGREFNLTMIGNDESRYIFKLTEDTESLEIPEEMLPGKYHYEIEISSASLFRRKKAAIALGSCVIGDLNYLRFMDRRIVIDSLTDNFNELAGHVFITPCYIDHIEFVDIEDTADGSCPVYQGEMYTDDYHIRYVFSYTGACDENGKRRMAVNPVRIVYIGDETLSITDPDGDGLYYCRYYDRYLKSSVYSLTDNEYTERTRPYYSNGDLYSYHTEKLTNV